MKIEMKDGEEFKRRLIKNGFSQRSFAKKIKIGNGYLSQIANGKRNPGPRTAKKITDALSLEFNDIFFIDDACNSDHNIEMEVS